MNLVNGVQTVFSAAKDTALFVSFILLKNVEIVCTVAHAFFSIITYVISAIPTTLATFCIRQLQKNKDQAHAHLFQAQWHLNIFKPFLKVGYGISAALLTCIFPLSLASYGFKKMADLASEGAELLSDRRPLSEPFHEVRTTCNIADKYMDNYWMWLFSIRLH